MRVETAPRCACAPPLDCSEGLAYYRQKSAVQLADIYLKSTHRLLTVRVFLARNTTYVHSVRAARAGVARAFGARVRVPLFHKSKETA